MAHNIRFFFAAVLLACPYAITRADDADAANPQYFQVDRGQITFDFEGNEGGQFHSRIPSVPTSKSGVTIGRGYDMKDRTPESVKQDLSDAGLPPQEASAYAKGAGLSGNDAKEFIADHSVASLTRQADTLGLKGPDREQFIEANALPEIMPEVQQKLFEIDYPRYEAAAQKRFPDFDFYPQAAKDAIVDILYNVGEKHFDSQFTEFRKAVSAEDWEGAAKESSRTGNPPPKKRNEATRDLFLKAKKEKEKRESWPKIGAFPTEYYVSLYAKDTPKVGELQGVFADPAKAQACAARCRAAENVARVEIEVSPGSTDEFPESAERLLRAVSGAKLNDAKSPLDVIKNIANEYGVPNDKLPGKKPDDLLKYLGSDQAKKDGWASLNDLAKSRDYSPIALANQLATSGYLVVGGLPSPQPGATGSNATHPVDGLVFAMLPSRDSDWGTATAVLPTKGTDEGTYTSRAALAGDIVGGELRDKVQFWATRMRPVE